MMPDASILSLFAAVEDGRWVLGIGDPTPMGWATVAGYLVAAVLCVLWAKPAGRGRLLPLALAAAMTLLAVNKQLDLQSLLTQIGRDAAKAQGWYEDRREYQVAFIAAIAGIAVLGFILISWLLRRRWRECTLALVGFAFLLAFIVVRAASFHRVDQGLGETWVGMRFNWILELGGIALVAAGAIVGWRLRARSRVISEPSSAKSASTPETPERPARPAFEVEVESEPRPPRPAKPGPLDGFVVRPIRLSSGPAARNGETTRANPSVDDRARSIAS
jgi:hypothetical protein